MIEVNHLSVSIGAVSILEDISFSISPGRMLGIVGHNGAGKTTLMRTVIGAIGAREGNIFLGGNDVTKSPTQRRVQVGVGYMPEDRRLIPELSVRNIILLPMEVSRIASTERERRLSTVLEMIPELVPLINRSGNQLSGGQQKLAALARAVCQGQKILLLDEPFEGVAPALVSRLSNVLQLLRKDGPTILITDSEGANLAGLCDQRLTIERGRIIADSVH